MAMRPGIRPDHQKYVGRVLGIRRVDLLSVYDIGIVNARGSAPYAGQISATLRLAISLTEDDVEAD